MTTTRFGRPRALRRPTVTQVTADLIRRADSRSHTRAAYYNNFVNIGTKPTPSTPAQVAAARRVLETHGALDVAEMLGLEVA